MRYIVLALSLLLMACGPQHVPTVEFADQHSFVWGEYVDLSEHIEEARRLDKVVLLLFDSEDELCENCYGVKYYSFMSEGVVNLVNKDYYPIKINTHKHPVMANYFGLNVPSVVFIHNKCQAKVVIEGYISSDDLSLILYDIATNFNLNPIHDLQCNKYWEGYPK